VGDVSGELPLELKEQGVDIEIVTPCYGTVNTELIGPKTFEYNVRFGGKMEQVQVYRGDLKDVPVHLVRNATYFEGKYGSPYINSPEIPFFDDILRFSFFSETCLEIIQRVQPDIVHINDWPLCYLFGRMVMENFTAKRVFTYHNIGYQGNIGKDTIRGMDIAAIAEDRKIGRLFEDPRREWHSVNAMRLGLELSDRVNTVSPNYCKESLEPEDPSRFFEGGKGLHEVTRRLFDEGKLTGILNGFEYRVQPTVEAFRRTLDEKEAIKKELSGGFSDPDRFLLGFIGRAVAQKFQLLYEILNGKRMLEHILAMPDVNVAIVATGVKEYETFLGNVRNNGNYICRLAFDKELAGKINKGSDVFLMPSLYEPCGITQLESMANATPPLVRWTGGLVDTVTDFREPGGTGFGFDGSSRENVLRNMLQSVRDAVDLHARNRDRFKVLQENGFKTRFLWSDAAKQYIENMYLPVMKPVKKRRTSKR
jgi:starch synthase